MDILRKIQEDYIQEFNNNIPIDEFILNILVTAFLVTLLRLFYIHFGTSISNRRKFANNFLPLALGTLLIIMIVKSSIALSLGLVGALSIVRFRAAIKDPEELTFLLLSIGIGLAGGANQPILAIVAFAAILILLFANRLLGGKEMFKGDNRLFVNIHTDIKDLNTITKVLSDTFTYVELKRLDTLDTGLDLSFICKAESLDQLSTAKDRITAISEKTRLSIVDQPDLIL